MNAPKFPNQAVVLTDIRHRGEMTQAEISYTLGIKQSNYTAYETGRERLPSKYLAEFEFCERNDLIAAMAKDCLEDLKRRYL